jgi:hypothetical protein
LFASLPVVGFIFFSPFISPVQQFVSCTLAAACNFWLVKNISGRKLVGLRWWAEFRDPVLEGASEGDFGKRWLFETRPQFTPNKHDARVFWWTLYGLPAIWTLLLLASLFSFSLFWTVCAALALGLHTVNLVGYSKCDKDAARRKAVGISL